MASCGSLERARSVAVVYFTGEGEGDYGYLDAYAYECYVSGLVFLESGRLVVV